MRPGIYQATPVRDMVVFMIRDDGSWRSEPIVGLCVFVTEEGDSDVDYLINDMEFPLKRLSYERGDHFVFPCEPTEWLAMFNVQKADSVARGIWERMGLPAGLLVRNNMA